MEARLSRLHQQSAANLRDLKEYAGTSARTHLHSYRGEGAQFLPLRRRERDIARLEGLTIRVMGLQAPAAQAKRRALLPTMQAAVQVLSEIP